MLLKFFRLYLPNLFVFTLENRNSFTLYWCAGRYRRFCRHFFSLWRCEKNFAPICNWLQSARRFLIIFENFYVCGHGVCFFMCLCDECKIPTRRICVNCRRTVLVWLIKTSLCRQCDGPKICYLLELKKRTKWRQWNMCVLRRDFKLMLIYKIMRYPISNNSTLWKKSCK